jgi:hypothetical protein
MKTIEHVVLLSGYKVTVSGLHAASTIRSDAMQSVPINNIVASFATR